MTVGPTDTNIELADLLVGIYSNVGLVQIPGQKRALVSNTCATMEAPPVLQTRYKEFEGIFHLFPVNSEIFTINEACELLN